MTRREKLKEIGELAGRLITFAACLLVAYYLVMT
jgi:hypothetical protein